MIVTDINVFREILLPIIPSVIAGIVQLLIEYRFFQGPQEPQATLTLGVERTGKSAAETRSERRSRWLLAMVRVIVVLVLTFSAVSVLAGIGYEARGRRGLITGVAAGFFLSLIAMWALHRWSRFLAKVVSAIALAVLLILTLIQVVMFLASFLGMDVNVISVTTGLLLIVVCIVVLGMLKLLGSLFPDSSLAEYQRNGIEFDEESQ
jgi:predicted tellurium resistance membrane protein TerC